MPAFRVSRRDCLAGLLAVPASSQLQNLEKQARVTNGALEFHLAVRGGKVTARVLANRLANETVNLPADDFDLEFEGGLRIASVACEAAIRTEAPGQIELLYQAPAGCEARVRYELPKDAAYLRKQISVRLTSPARRLMRADLDNWRGVRRKWRSMAKVDRLPYASQPVYSETLWAGVEFVAAFNEYGPEGFVLRSRPGGPRIQSEWYTLNSTVIGCAEPGRVRESFLRYIEDVRLAPPRLVACYNTWWTYYAKDIGSETYRAILIEMKEKLRDRHGIFFDIVTTDEGWADRHSIWRIDQKKLPRGFDDIRAVVESAGGRLGLWISPSAVYPNSTDCDWAKANGYYVVEFDYRPPARHPGLSLADPKYRNEVIARLEQLIRENRLGHVKYDGLIARESRGHHDLLPGDDSVEPIARHSFELIAASKRANPDLVSEPTYLNSHSNYISPWIIKYADFVWANSGGDCPKGVGVPAPDYRESHTSSREYYIFSSLNEVWLPQNAVQYFDIVHCDDDPGFANHAAMAFGRGRFFLPTYVNPKYMSDDDWRIYAGFLKWVRRNEAILRNTHITPSRVELGEPYVYAHWLDDRGILAVRNPSNETAAFEIDLRRERAPSGLSDALCYAQYPYRKGIAAGLSAVSKIPLRLAPWELLFLEIIPRAKLPEPVVIGARWRRGAGGPLEIAPEAGAASVRILKPDGTQDSVSVTPPEPLQLAGEIISYSLQRLAPPGKPAATTSFEIECSVSIPQGAEGQALLLLQFPGREHHPNNCRAWVNGNPVSLRESSSQNRIGYMEGPNSRWKDVLPHQSNWSWHICEVRAGQSSVRFSGSCSAPECKIGLWVWAERDVFTGAKHFPTACPEPQLPPYREGIERHGICLRRP